MKHKKIRSSTVVAMEITEKKRKAASAAAVATTRRIGWACR